MSDKILIRVGIDPGVKTGISSYDVKFKKLLSCDTVGIVVAMDVVVGLYYDDNLTIEVWFEDARQRKWFGNSGREKLQGAGSIKRDCSIWQEFCKSHEIPYRMIPPAHISTKLKQKVFSKVTGWTGRTSEHARDAAMIVFGS